ncbi:MAG: DUF285 domain-containing protein, partial [Lachnospiraceae bacterium]|nr:DUF285 domain-containing protein [Lachnospiraceae bacterium]
MTGSRYLRRKRILGISAIVLAMLLVALPVFSRAEEVGTTLNNKLNVASFRNMCNDAGLGESINAITKVTCVPDLEGDGWIECGESGDPNMLMVRLSGTELEIYVPQQLTSISGEIGLSEPGTSNQFINADPFNIDPLLRKIDTSNWVLMQNMFAGIRHAASLDVSNFDTGNVLNMGSMFYGCSSLEELDLSGFDTAKVANMHAMFSGCSSLQSLDLSSFDTSAVNPETNGYEGSMRSMFSNC